MSWNCYVFKKKAGFVDFRRKKNDMCVTKMLHNVSKCHEIVTFSKMFFGLWNKKWSRHENVTKYHKNVAKNVTLYVTFLKIIKVFEVT